MSKSFALSSTPAIPAPVVDATLRKMQKLRDTAADGANAKSKASAARRLKTMAFTNPDLAAELGVSVEDHQISRVMRFGCLCGPVVIDEPQWANAARLQMTLSHDLYNHLVASSRPLYAMAIAELMSYPNFRALHNLNNEVSALYQQIREINREARSKVESPVVAELKDRIAALKADMDDLRLGVGPEMASFYRSDTCMSIRGNGGLLPMMLKAGYNKYNAMGLYYTNYNPVVADFRRAFEGTFKKAKTILRGLQPRYAFGNGEYPESITSWQAWDGAGQVGTLVQQSKAPTKKDPKRLNPDKAIPTVLAGTNGFFRLRRMTADDLVHFPLLRKRKIDFTRKASERLYIAEVRVVGPKSEGVGGRSVYASIPVLLHRPLPIDGKLASAVIDARKDGFRLVHSLLVTVKFSPTPAENEGAVAKLTIGTEQEEPVRSRSSEIGSFTHTKGDAFLAWANGVKQMAGKGGQPSRAVKRFDWISGNTLLPNTFMTVATERSHELDSKVNEYLKMAMKSLTELLPTVRMPDWFTAEGFELRSRQTIRRCYRVWRGHVIDAAAERSGDEAEAVKQAFRTLRRNGSKLVKLDWDMAVNAIAYQAEDSLGLPLDQAKVLAVLSLATERYEHLYPWAANLRSRSLRRRKDEYRQFAVQFLRGCSEVHLPAPGANRKRFLSDAERTFSSSSLIDAIKSVAQREGVKIVSVKAEKVKAAPAPVTKVKAVKVKAVPVKVAKLKSAPVKVASATVVAAKVVPVKVVKRRVISTKAVKRKVVPRRVVPAKAIQRKLVK